MGEPPAVSGKLRSRLVAVAAEVLPSLGTVPGPLRRIVTFTPTRRAKAGSAALWAALADDDFRERVATQWAAVRTDEDPLDAAATAWLERPEGWERTVEEQVAARSVDHGELDRLSEQAERLREQVQALQAEARATRAEHREREAALKEEVARLRRTLGEARAAHREAVAERDQAVERAAEATRGAARQSDRAAGDVRRLEDALAQAQSAVHRSRSEARGDRDAANTRAWYLLDALVESATGLRRELGLPAAAAAPAQGLEQELLGDGVARGVPATVTVLESLLALPRARLIVDGYNVSKAAWSTATLEAQRSRLVTALAPVVARTGAETTVVFDGAAGATRAAVPTPRGVRAIFSPPGVIADDVIRQLVDAEPRGRTVVVVTSDRALAADVAREGARTVASDVLISLLAAH